ncbi:putative bifunctional diguanylate cyclase/phosphodiesterase [Caulobacter hibisci]|uniref:EAL domain-containing protein n=1 Tax=Caulobacter hibisci TaxID=2035993 RepID=A0ABS0T0A9_9CAUL|nr:EAL domain-containing protein [Caulobacter hibisci]MBI1685298.1 EAL domain-containing protein [Caulobacter hibisci]
MFNRLQTKLTVLYAGLFALALGAIAVTVYLTIAGTAQQAVRQELTATGGVFDRVWALRTQRLRDGADILSRDFGFRAAVATRDAPTIDSALANLRGRMGLDLAVMMNVDGELTGVDPSKLDAERLWTALDAEDGAGGVFMVDGEPYQLISAPILSPTLTGWVVFGVRLDDREMQALERLSSIRLDADVFNREGQQWRAENAERQTPALSAFVANAAKGDGAPGRIQGPGGDELVLVKPLKTLGGGASSLVLRYPLALALAPYRPLLAAVVLAGLVGAALVIVASWMLSRGLARPIAELDAAAQELEQGREVHVVVQTRDEIGRLADSFNRMAHGIRDREARITHLAMHDPETGLANRHALEAEIAARMAADPTRPVIIGALGLDRFTFVRGAIGYTLATELIVEIGERVRAHNPDVMVGRLTTSTLCVVSSITDLEEAVAIVTSATPILEAPVRLGGDLVDIHVSNGLAAGRHGEIAPHRLIEQAMIALDQARDAGRKASPFDQAAYGDPASNLSLMSEMLEAVRTGALFLNHQPKLDLRTGAITGAEALARWIHPTRGFLGPDLFVGMAEETGHIRALTDYVIDQAIADQQALRAAGHDLVMSVNISGRLIDDLGFARQAIARVSEAGARMCFEITETAVVGNAAVALQVLEQFKAAGIAVSIDDYGSGLSSLAYLKQIPADELKIDKAFVMGMDGEAKDALLVKSTVDLAHSLGLKVVAEGVESREALAMLQVMGCDIAQGYHIAKPMALPALTEFLTRWGAEDEAADPRAKQA